MSARGRILVVDDDALVGRLLVRLLAACGYDAIEARSLAAAHQALAAGGFAAIVCDNALGDGSGLDFARGLAGSGAPPVILVSGSPDVLATARAALGLATLDKPMDRAQVEAALRQVGLDPG